MSSIQYSGSMVNSVRELTYESLPYLHEALHTTQHKPAIGQLYATPGRHGKFTFDDEAQA